MSEPLVRVACQATLDEMVVVTMRQVRMTREGHSWRWKAALSSGAAVAVLIVVAVGTSPLRTESRALAIAGVVAMVVGTLVAYLAGHVHDDSSRRRIRFLAEQMAGAESLAYEIELRADGILVRQAGSQSLIDWSEVSAVNDEPGGVELRFKTSLLVADSRAFPGAAEREAFVSHARRLSGIY